MFEFYRSRILLFTVASSNAVLVVGCKQRTEVSSVRSLGAEDNLVEVIDCTPAICGNPQSMVAVGQDPGDQTIAMDMKRGTPSSEIYALSDTTNENPAKETSATSKSFEKSAFLNGLAAQLWQSNDKTTPASQAGLSTLLSTLNPMLAKVEAAKTFAQNSIDAPNENERLRTLEVLKSFTSEVSKNSVKDGDKILSSLEVLAGLDGFLNFGDQSRIGAPIPQIAGRIADQKIADEVPGIIAQKKYEYKSQMLFGGFFFGGIVDRRVEEAVMGVASRKKWEAVNNAAMTFQSDFSKAMTSLGVQSYYLLASNQSKRYLDPAPQVTEQQLISVVESVSGKRFSDLLSQAKNSGGNVSFIPSVTNLGLDAVTRKISLPDGIPLAEIRRLSKASAGFTKTVFPEGLKFKLLADGRMEIRHNRDAASQTPIGTAGESNGITPGLNCTAITKMVRGQFNMFLYSSAEGARLKMLTAAGYFEMLTPNIPQPPHWNFVRSGGADPKWANANKVRIMLEKDDGNVQFCVGTIYHM